MDTHDNLEPHQEWRQGKSYYVIFPWRSDFENPNFCTKSRYSSTYSVYIKLIDNESKTRFMFWSLRSKIFSKSDLEFRVYSILLTLLKLCCKKEWLTQVTFNDKDETTSVGEVTRPAHGISKNDGGKHDRKRDLWISCMPTPKCLAQSFVELRLEVPDTSDTKWKCIYCRWEWVWKVTKLSFRSLYEPNLSCLQKIVWG